MSYRFERAIVLEVLNKLRHPNPLIQIITGPRQVGKTTAAHQIEAKWEGPVHFVAADSSLPLKAEWIEAQWHIARKKGSENAPCLLVLDEVQKVAGWGETVKLMFDRDRTAPTVVRPMILGSSALLLSQGTTESLAGRFFLHRAPHWSFAECRTAFGWDLDTWLYFGGYPGAVPFINDEESWCAYIYDSLIETVLTRDVLSLHNIAKPALLRHLFGLAAQMPAGIVSYNKMLGQLTDAGNTTTLAHYLRLMEQAFFVSGLEKFSRAVMKKKSSPKLILWNNALITAAGRSSYNSFLTDPALRGRLVENAVGAHLLNHLQGMRYDITYWRHGNHEVDFVVSSPSGVVAVEVKSGAQSSATDLARFKQRYEDTTSLIVGTGGVPLDDFFSTHPRDLL